MSLTIIQPGLLDTLQDMGRTGYRHLGINPGGAMDILAMQMANMLVGNDPYESVLEIHFPAPVCLFRDPGVMAVAGADFSVAVDGDENLHGRPFFVKEGSVLTFKNKIKWERAYLAVKGGWQADNWLHSDATNMRLGYGGHEGRALKKGDELFFKNKQLAAEWRYAPAVKVSWGVMMDSMYEKCDELLILPGKDWYLLTEESKLDFLQQKFYLTPQADRMGYRLRGKALYRTSDEELLSSAVTRGTIQLLPDGQLIILMADHQVTGGYPVIGNVITACLPPLAQRSAGACLTFNMTDIDTAEYRWRRQQQNLRMLQYSTNLKWMEA